MHLLQSLRSNAKPLLICAAFGVLGAGLVSCGGEKAQAATIVRADEWNYHIELRGDTTIPAGRTTFVVTNEGPAEHQFDVIRTDLSPDALPQIKDTGPEGGASQFGNVPDQKVNEDAVDELGVIEPQLPGKTSTMTLDLKPGHYVVICNVDKHYMKGMRTEFTVK